MFLWAFSSQCWLPWSEPTLRPTAIRRPMRPREELSSPRIHDDRGLGDFERSVQLLAHSFSMAALLLARTGRSARVVVFEGTICSLVQSLVCPRFHTLLLLSSRMEDFSGVGSHATLNGNWRSGLPVKLSSGTQR